MSIVKSLLASLLRILCGVPIIALLVSGSLLLMFAETWKGRSVGLCIFLFGGMLYCSIGYWNRPWFAKSRRRLVATLLPLIAVLYLIPMFLSPNGRGSENGRLQNRFVGNRGSFQRYSPWNVVPEVDHVAVGMRLVPLFDPYVDFAKSRRIRSLVNPIYQEMERDPAFQSLGSVTGLACRDLLRVDFRTGHYFQYLPDTQKGQRVPCLIYLHGMGGNRKTHFWVFSQISKKLECAVIAPSFGLGNWDQDGGTELVIDVAEEAKTTLPIDPDRIFLLGYSNGAVAVTRAAIRRPDLFRGLIYLSPVTEDQLFWTSGFLSKYHDRKILFLHGGQDLRIPRSVVENTVTLLKQNDCTVELVVFDEEDHYLIVSQPEKIADEIIDYISGNF